MQMDLLIFSFHITEDWYHKCTGLPLWSLLKARELAAECEDSKKKKSQEVEETQHRGCYGYTKSFVHLSGQT